MSDLHGGHPRLAHFPEERTDILADGVRHLLPGRAQLFPALVDVRSSRVSERECPTVAVLVRSDQAFVLELGERRVNRPRARAPDTVRAALDLLHELIAVQLPLAQQQERRSPDIATSSPRTAREPTRLTEERAESSPAPERRPMPTAPMRHPLDPEARPLDRSCSHVVQE